MNITEAVRLLRKIKAYRPHQEMDEFTAEAWAEILEDVDYVDANEAVKQLGSEIPYIGTDDVAKRVRHIRTRRVTDGEADLIPGPDFTVPQYLAWLRDSRRRLADGETAAEINGPQPELKPRNLRALEAA
jgi:hypothetical protein